MIPVKRAHRAWQSSIGLGERVWRCMRYGGNRARKRIVCVTLMTLTVLMSPVSGHAEESDVPVCPHELVFMHVSEGSLEALARCLEWGYPVAYEVSPVATWAVNFDQPEVLDLLVRHGLDVSADEGPEGGNLLVVAVTFNRLNMTRQLIRHGAQVNRHPALGRSPLFYAIFHAEDMIAGLLIKSGAKLNAKDVQTLAFLERTYREDIQVMDEHEVPPLTPAQQRRVEEFHRKSAAEDAAGEK